MKRAAAISVAARSPNGASSASASATRPVETRTGPCDPVEGGQRLLAPLVVLASGLPQHRGVRRVVEEIVGELEGAADDLAIAAQARPVARTGIGDEARPRRRRRSARRSSSPACARFRLRQTGFSAARSSTCPPTMPPRRRRVARSATARRGPPATGALVRHETEGEGQQAVARQDRRRLVKGPVDGRPAAPEIVVVHRRQIVMDERVAVDALEREAAPTAACGRAEQRAVSITRKGRSRLPPPSAPCRMAAISRAGAPAPTVRIGIETVRGPRFRQVAAAPSAVLETSVYMAAFALLSVRVRLCRAAARVKPAVRQAPK